MIKASVIAFFLPLALGLATAPPPASAQEAPALEELTAQITAQLPAWIRVDGVRPHSSEKSGDTLITYFDVSTTVTEDLFREVRYTLELRDFAPPDAFFYSVLTRSGTTKVLAATAKTFPNSGVIQTTTKFDERHVIEKLGYPRSAFPKSAIPWDSDQAKVIHDQTKAKAEAFKQESRQQMLGILGTFNAPEVTEAMMGAVIESILDDHHKDPDVVSVTKLDFIRNSPTAVLPGDGRLGLQVYSIAEVTVNQDLYMVDTLQSGLESLQFLKVSAKAGETVKVFARTSLLFADGKWDLAFGRNNSAAIRLGTSEDGREYHRIGFPLAAFEGDGLPIFGTPEFEAAQAALAKPQED